MGKTLIMTARKLVGRHNTCLRLSEGEIEKKLGQVIEIHWFSNNTFNNLLRNTRAENAF